LRLLYRDGLGNLALTDAAGSEPEVLTWDSLCPEEVRDDNCGARSDEGGVAFSPDSTRLAYTIAEGRDADVSTIAVLDLSTRQVTRVESTRSNALIPCTTAASAGDNARPTWSPDGSQLVFERQAIGPVRNGGCQAAVFVVNADGSDLRQLVSAEMVAIHPSWSADGTRIVFQSSTFLPGYPQDDTALTSDVYSVRPDVSDLRRLSIDGLSIAPRWTRDGRIVFRHRDTGGLSIMNADGDVATQIRDDSIPDLTAVACVTCPYALAAGDGEAFWQPAP
jgi:Tol biopolymer transport system component